jgi:hypothetical protein
MCAIYHKLIILLDLLPYFSCGLPCEHVLRITNEIRHEMIHVQNWKIYASHYSDDSTMLGWELKKAQLDYKKYGEIMGVPVTEDIVSQAKRPGIEGTFPYLFEGTSIEDYNQAIFIEQNKNYITIREWMEREETLKPSVSAAKMPLATLQDMECHDCPPLELLTGLDSVDDLFPIDNTDSDETLTDIKRPIQK